MTCRCKAAWSVAGLLGAGAAVAGAVFSLYALRSLPTWQGHQALPGLAADVVVRRDAADVTHIFSRSRTDAFRALGMAHAKERPWQLEMNRRVMHGRLSEVFGPAALDTDKLLLTLGIRQAAQAQFVGLPAQARAELSAYAEGINTWLAMQAQPLPPEFKLMGIDPSAMARKGEFWTAVDCVGWALMMALDLGGNWGQEYARLAVLQRLDTQRLWELMPAYPSEQPASRTDMAALYRQLGVFAPAAASNTSRAAAPTGVAHAAQSAPDERVRDILAWSDNLGNVEGKGSNNWVVAGSRTTTGKPLLANDPHLGLSAPAIWYFARLQTAAQDGEPEGLDTIGATLPGLPFVVLGRNAHVAWGFTNTGPDVQDLYLEQINPVNPNQYRVPAPDGQLAWADFALRAETIPVKGQASVTHVVRSTRHGPVLTDAQPNQAKVIDTSKYVLALRWSALDPDNQTVLAGLNGPTSSTVDELLQAYRHYHSPMQNLVVADTAGNVAYKAAGKVPVRSPENDLRGLAPAPGWDARYDWQGWIPYSETPSALIPADNSAASSEASAGAASQALAQASATAVRQGWLATANQRIHGADYPHFLTQDWSAPYRYDRIASLLHARPKHDLNSLRDIQADVVSLAALRLLPFLKEARSAHPLATQALAELNNFDGTMAADRAAPLIISAWVDEFTRLTVGERLGQDRFAMLYGKRQFRSAVEDMLIRNDSFWCGDQGCRAALGQALTQALDRLQRQHGPNVQRWRWGPAHAAVSKHTPMSKVAALAPWFEVRVPTGGDPFTVNVGQYHLDDPALPFANRHAASLRALYDLADPENSRFIYQTGQSGNAFSPRYRDMATAWAAVQYRPLQLRPARWISELTLRP